MHKVVKQELLGCFSMSGGPLLESHTSVFQERGEKFWCQQYQHYSSSSFTLRIRGIFMRLRWCACLQRRILLGLTSQFFPSMSFHRCILIVFVHVLLVSQRSLTISIDWLSEQRFRRQEWSNASTDGSGICTWRRGPIDMHCELDMRTSEIL